MRRTLTAAVAAAAFSTSLLALTGPASATPVPWIAAADSNGALGNCDPGELSTTLDEGTTWPIQTSAFQATPSPCALGGRINSVSAAPSGRLLAAGYRNTPAGLRQGILLYSKNYGGSWTIVRQIPAGPTNTEYVDVAADGTEFIALADPPVLSAKHSSTGPMNTGWLTPAVSINPNRQDYFLRDVDLYRSPTPPYFTNKAYYVGSSLTANDGRCGVLAKGQSYIIDIVEGTACLNGYDVRLEAVHATSPVIAVGSATPPGQLTQPVAVTWTGWSPTTTVLPGSGGLKSIEGGANNVVVAVGFKRVNGTKVASIFRSTNLGVTWKPVAAPTGAKPLNKVIYQPSGWVAVGDDGTLLRSTDGTTWTTGNAPSTKTLRSITAIP